jgi:hypothetical protein
MRRVDSPARTQKIEPMGRLRSLLMDASISMKTKKHCKIEN